MFLIKLAAGVGLSTLFWRGLQARGETTGAPVVVKEQGYVPFSGAPIDYRSENLNDPLSRLQQRLDHGEIKLD